MTINIALTSIPQHINEFRWQELSMMLKRFFKGSFFSLYNSQIPPKFQKELKHFWKIQIGENAINKMEIINYSPKTTRHSKKYRIRSIAESNEGDVIVSHSWRNNIQLSSIVMHIAIDAEGLGFDSRGARIWLSVANGACIAQAPRRGDGPATRYTLRSNAASMMKIWFKQEWALSSRGIPLNDRPNCEVAHSSGSDRLKIARLWSPPVKSTIASVILPPFNAS